MPEPEKTLPAPFGTIFNAEEFCVKFEADIWYPLPLDASSNVHDISPDDDALVLHSSGVYIAIYSITGTSGASEKLRFAITDALGNPVDLSATETETTANKTFQVSKTILLALQAGDRLTLGLRPSKAAELCIPEAAALLTVFKIAESYVHPEYNNP